MRKCLIVVDYQKDFVTGSLGFPKAEELEARIVEKIRQYHAEQDSDVIFTLDTHKNDYLDTYEGRHLPVAHCIEGTEGHELSGAVKAECSDEDLIFCKPCFGSAQLYEHLLQTPYDSVELVGVVTNICVISNAVLAKTAQPETEIIVDASCVASNDDGLNEAALAVMESLQMKVINRKKETLKHNPLDLIEI